MITDEYRSLSDLTMPLTIRWKSLLALLGECFERGMRLQIVDGPDIREAAPEVWFASGGAAYISWQRRLLMTRHIAFGPTPEYPQGYRPDIHEIGHAVWSLVLTPIQRWLGYWPLWRKGRAQGTLPGQYAATKVEEGFAEDFEAFFRQQTLIQDEQRRQWLARTLGR